MEKISIPSHVPFYFLVHFISYFIFHAISCLISLSPPSIFSAHLLSLFVIISCHPMCHLTSIAILHIICQCMSHALLPLITFHISFYRLPRVTRLTFHLMFHFISRIILSLVPSPISSFSHRMSSLVHVSICVCEYLICHRISNVICHFTVSISSQLQAPAGSSYRCHNSSRQ